MDTQNYPIDNKNYDLGTSKEIPMKTKIIWGVVALVVIAGGVYTYSLWQKSQQAVPQGQATESLRAFSGVLVSASEGDMKITVQASGAGSVKTVLISPATKIERVISQRSKSGLLERQYSAEINISDLAKGDAVTVAYLSEKDSILSGVASVITGVDGNVDEYVKKAAQLQVSGAEMYFKVQIVSVDSAGKKIQYKPYLFDTIGATVMTADIPSGVSVYKVDDPMRVEIRHALVPINIGEVRSGQTVFLKVDSKALREGKAVPTAIIVLEK